MTLVDYQNLGDDAEDHDDEAKGGEVEDDNTATDATIETKTVSLGSGFGPSKRITFRDSFFRQASEWSKSLYTFAAWTYILSQKLNSTLTRITIFGPLNIFNMVDLLSFPSRACSCPLCYRRFKTAG